MNTLDKLLSSGDISRDQVMEAAVRFLKEWEPMPGAGRLPVLTEMVVKTRRPDDWLLTDRVSGKTYEWHNGWKMVA